MHPIVPGHLLLCTLRYCHGHGRLCHHSTARRRRRDRRCLNSPLVTHTYAKKTVERISRRLVLARRHGRRAGAATACHDIGTGLAAVVEPLADKVRNDTDT